MPRAEFVADSSVLIRRLRNAPDLESYFNGRGFAATWISLAELELGNLKSRDPKDGAKQVLQLLNSAKLLFSTTRTSFLYAKICFDLQKRGEMIPINDIWIAARCLEARLPLLARDAHFNRVANLEVIQCP